MRKTSLAWLAGTIVASAALVLPGCGSDSGSNCQPVGNDGGADVFNPIPRIDSGRDAGAVAATDLGKGCAAKADCTGGLDCVSPLAGTVAHGYCSASCTAQSLGGASICQPFGGLCVDFGSANPDAICLEPCFIGSSVSGGGGLPPKCHGRTDVACFPSDQQDGTGFCAPMCASDSDCAGKKCDPASGLCQATVAPSLPLGSHCTPPARGTPSTECPICLSIVEDTTSTAPALATFCSTLCRLGGACTVGAAAGLGGACLLANDQNSAIGDLGYCAQLCDKDADCLNQTDHFICDKTLPFQGHGTCGIPLPADAGPEGGPADAAHDTAAEAAPASDGGLDAADVVVPDATLE